MGNIRKIIRELVLEACSCPFEDVEEDVIEPVYDMIIGSQGSYPHHHTDQEGRMLDYGKVKSDSHEGRMTKAKLFRMGKMAQSFHDRLEDGDDLPGWVQDKVTTAEDRLSSAYNYIDYKLHRMKTEGKMCNENIVRSMARNYLRSVL